MKKFFRDYYIAIIAAVLFAYALITTLTVDKCKAHDLNTQFGRISALADGCKVDK